MAGKVKVRITPEWAKFEKEILKLRTTKAHTGFFDAKPHPNGNGLSIADVAHLNNSGFTKYKLDNNGNRVAIVTPARPFADKSIGDPDKALPILKKAITDLVLGGTARSVMKRAAVTLADDVQETILGWTDPPNAEMTVQKKGFNNPLVEDGTLHNAAEGRVGKKR